MYSDISIGYTYGQCAHTRIISEICNSKSNVKVKMSTGKATFLGVSFFFGACYRTIDSLAVAYGKGKLTCFLGDLKAVVDAVRINLHEPN